MTTATGRTRGRPPSATRDRFPSIPPPPAVVIGDGSSVGSGTQQTVALAISARAATSSTAAQRIERFLSLAGSSAAVIRVGLTDVIVWTPRPTPITLAERVVADGIDHAWRDVLDEATVDMLTGPGRR